VGMDVVISHSHAIYMVVTHSLCHRAYSARVRTGSCMPVLTRVMASVWPSR
jgi:hypothetical protein